MLAKRAITVLLLLLFASLVSAELLLKKKIPSREISDAWPLLVFAATGSATAILGRRSSATPILSLLLASMGTILSWGSIYEFGEEMSWFAAEFFRFEWSALQLLFGFSFVHFALIFPIESGFVRNRPRRIWLLYGIYGLLLVTALARNRSGEILPTAIAGKGSEVFLAIQLLSIFAGLLLGVIALIRKYFVSLTSAEKNRLRVVLIGCLAGAIPAAFAAISGMRSESSRQSPLEYGLLMLPLFPLGLVTAVLHENFAEINKWLQRTLIYCLAAAGSITCFFLCYWIAELLGISSSSSLAISAAVFILAIFPLFRCSNLYVSNCFCASDDSEPQLERGDAAFHPIDPNPYIVGNPILSPELFFGREEDFRFIKTKLQTEQQGCVIVLRGERRTGKTSILYQILNGRLGTEFIPVFMDMQGVIVQSDAELLLEFAAKIREAVLAGILPDDNSLPAVPDSYAGFNLFMDAALAAIGRRRLVLLIDEYELIEAKVHGGRLSSEIFGYLDSLLVRHSRLSYVFTGSKELEFTASWAPILAKSVYRDVSYLARKDAQALVVNPIRRYGIRFTQNALNQTLRLTNGHPFFTQALCQSLVEVLNELRTPVVEWGCIEEALKRLLENPPPQLYYQWTTFSSQEKVVLSGLATSLKEADTYLTAERLEKLLRSLPGEFPKKLRAPVIRMHLEQLREKMMLDRDQTRYRFAMDLMRLWVQSEHNVWKVLSETG
jgi:hypothetical protein